MSRSISVEWVNVTYRSVGALVLGVFVLVLGGGATWFYFQRYSPREDALAAISRAESRLLEAQTLPADGAVGEIVANARLSLESARREFASADFEESRIAAIRSENFSLRAISLLGGDLAKSRMVRFYLIEGDVRVKQAGEFSWKRADESMVLRVGDQVKTSSSGSAELIYFDGTITTIRPGSLLEIRDLYEDPVTKVRRVSERLTWGEVQASTQDRNVQGSFHEVATEKVAARTERKGEFRIAFDQEKKTAVVDVFDGSVQVATPEQRDTVDAGERVRTGESGKLSTKQTLPGVPRLLAPSDQRVFIFEDPFKETITLRWDPVGGADRYRLMISDRTLFTDPLYDSERRGTSAVIDGIPSGSYYWRVTALSANGASGPFSEARRFRVSSEQIRDRADTEPPRLEITEFVPVGQMVIINGETEPGANLWIGNAKIDVYDSGSFNAVVRLHKEGTNELVLTAQDNAGNETVVKRSLFVEIY